MAGSGRGARGPSTCHPWAMDRPSEGHEQQIAQWIRQGESRGYGELLAHYGGRIAGYLRKRFPSLDDHDIHDVLADAMLALADSFDASRGSLPAWFLLLARQRAVGRLRKRSTRPVWEPWASDYEGAARGGTPPEQLATHERLAAVEQVIGDLSTLEQAVVRADLDAGNCVPAAALADQLRTTTGSVYAARQRARRKLLARCPWIRDMLGEKGAADGESA